MRTLRLPRSAKILLTLVVVVFSSFPLGCAGAYVGVSVPVGYSPYGARGPYGGWGPTVGVTVPLGRPIQY